MSALDQIRREVDERAELRALAQVCGIQAFLPAAGRAGLAQPKVTDPRLRPAASREACKLCATRGDLGCIHQRAYEP